MFGIVSPMPLKEKDTLEAFAENSKAKADFTIVVRDEPGLSNGISTTRRNDVIEVAMDASYLPGITVANLLDNVRAAHLIIEKGAFILHSSHVSTDKGSILFTAASGTGKSTQADFWRQARGTETVNEDRTIVKRADNGYLACGCWATGSGDICANVTSKIRGIVMLKQADGNRVRVPRPSEILRHIVPQCTFNENDINSCIGVIDLVADMIGKIPVIELGCVNDVSSVYELEKYI